MTPLTNRRPIEVGLPFDLRNPARWVQNPSRLYGFTLEMCEEAERLGVGTAILIAPLHHPAEIAEQSVVVDSLSGGRLDLGLGTGYRVPEYELFDASLTARHKQTDDTVRRLRELWGHGVRPRPVQDPVPVWLGY